MLNCLDLCPPRWTHYPLNSIDAEIPKLDVAGIDPGLPLQLLNDLRASTLREHRLNTLKNSHGANQLKMTCLDYFSQS